MGTKTISIMNDVYERLKAIKTPKESFSEQLRRLTETRSIMDLAGAWKEVDEEDYEKFKKGLKEARKSSRIQELAERLK